MVVNITKSTMTNEIVSLSVNYTSPLSRSPTAAPTANCKASGIRDQIEAGILQRGVKFDDLDKKDPR